MPGCQKLQVKQQAAVAIFRQTGEFVNPGDSYTRCEDGLDERVGQPLGQLVERHEAGGHAWAGNLTVTPDITEVDSTTLRRPGQIGPRLSSTASKIWPAGKAPSDVWAER